MSAWAPRLLELAAGLLLAALALRWLWGRFLPWHARRVLRKLWDPAQKRDDQPKLRRVRRGRHTWTLGWKMPPGASSEKWQTLANDISESLNCSTVVWYQNGKTWLRLGVRRLPRKLGYQRFYGQRRPAGELVFGIGCSQEGTVWADLGVLLHLLVGGMNGSGKSRFLAQLIVSLAEGYSPRQLRMLLIDLKGKGAPEFSRYASLPHLDGPVIGDIESCKKALAELELEMDERYRRIAQAGCSDITEYNAGHPEAPLPRKLVVIDEFADLTARFSGPELKAFERLVAELRACGVHMVIATQRPDANVVPGQIRNNMGAVLAFRTGNRTSSEVLLGDGHAGAVSLPPGEPGMGIWQHGSDMRVRGIFLSPQEAEARVARLAAQPFREPALAGSVVEGEAVDEEEEAA